jgi:hypothetical protein
MSSKNLQRSATSLIDGCKHRLVHWGIFLGVAIATSLSCKAREAEFYGKAFPCDMNAACGTTADGKPMACYPTHLVGGQDFCAAACQPGMFPEDDAGFACVGVGVGTGALLQRCRPVAGRTDPRHECPEGLECYRTDLLTDEGLCLMMHVCAENADCSNRTDSRQACGGELVQLVTSSSSLPIASDNLMCIQPRCSTQGSSACPPDEACLFNSYDSGNVLPDICVPKCDGGRRCPPNFSCARRPSSPQSPALCIPGVPGVRCDANQDCLIGECVDTGAGFNICTLDLPCSPMDFCAELSGPADVFVCAEGFPGKHRCVTTRPFVGANCVDANGCPPGQECFWHSPVEAIPDHGECRVPCGADGRCEPRGGIPFLCLGENQEGGCFPTGFGLPCLDDSECYQHLVCALVGPDVRSLTNYKPRICTTACTSDADCDADRLTLKGAFCQLETGFCRLSGRTGAACTQDTHCRSNRCNAGTGTCLE